MIFIFIHVYYCVCTGICIFNIGILIACFRLAPTTPLLLFLRVANKFSSHDLKVLGFSRFKIRGVSLAGFPVVDVSVTLPENQHST